MKCQIRKFKFISTVTLKALNLINIYNTSDLIESANTDDKRLSLHLATGISVNELEYITSVSDLIRIKGIAVRTARKLIDKCNIRNVQEIARYYQKNTCITDDVKFAKMIKILEENSISLDKFLDFSEEATELKYRVVFNGSCVTTDELHDKFMSELRQESNRQTISHIKITLQLGLWTAVFLIVACVFLYYPYFVNYKSLDTQFLNGKIDLFLPVLWLDVFHLVSGTVIFGSSVGLYITITYLLTEKLSLFIMPILYKRNPLKKAFLQFEYMKLIKSFEKSTPIILLWIIFIIIVIITSLLMQKTYLSKYFTMIFMFVASIIIYLKDIKFYRNIKENRKLTTEVYQRMLFASHIEALFQTFVLLVAIKIYIPFVLDLIHKWENNMISKMFQNQYQEAINLINSSNIDLEIVEYLKIAVKKGYSFVPIFGFDDLPSELFDLFPMILLWFIMGLMLSFLIPNFKFFGFRNGVLYLIIILGSMVASFIVDNIASTWMFINSSNMIKYLFIFGFSFWFAILFDLFYKTILSKQQDCQFCGELIDDKFNYCPNCGSIKN